MIQVGDEVEESGRERATKDRRSDRVPAFREFPNLAGPTDLRGFLLPLPLSSPLYTFANMTSLLPTVFPTDYSLVVATGTLGVYSLLTFQSITVSKARKIANVEYPAPYAENSEAKRDIKAKKFSTLLSSLVFRIDSKIAD